MWLFCIFFVSYYTEYICHNDLAKKWTALPRSKVLWYNWNDFAVVLSCIKAGWIERWWNCGQTGSRLFWGLRHRKFLQRSWHLKPKQENICLLVGSNNNNTSPHWLNTVILVCLFDRRFTPCDDSPVQNTINLIDVLGHTQECFADRTAASIKWWN